MAAKKIEIYQNETVLKESRKHQKWFLHIHPQNQQIQ
jgi:hypothetical protein